MYIYLCFEREIARRGKTIINYQRQILAKLRLVMGGIKWDSLTLIYSFNC